MGPCCFLTGQQLGSSVSPLYKTAFGCWTPGKDFTTRKFTLLFLEPIIIPAPSPEPYFMNSKGLEICRPSATQRVEILPRLTFFPFSLLRPCLLAAELVHLLLCENKRLRIGLWREAWHKVTNLIKSLQFLGFFKYRQFEYIIEPEHSVILCFSWSAQKQIVNEKSWDNILCKEPVSCFPSSSDMDLRIISWCIQGWGLDMTETSPRGSVLLDCELLPGGSRNYVWLMLQ